VHAVTPAISCALETEVEDDPDAGLGSEDGGMLDAESEGNALDAQSEGGSMLDAQIDDGAVFEVEGDGGTPALEDAGGMDAGDEVGDDAALGSDDADAELADGECAPPEPPGPPPPAPLPDDTACLPAPKQAIGSGLNRAFAVHCDPVLLLCVLSGEPPSLR
jgi:hypothetical protein